MTKEYKRILAKKKTAGLTWDKLAKKAKIGVSTWMTGVTYVTIPDDEVKAIAPILKTTFEWLKYGTGQEWIETESDTEKTSAKDK